MCTSMITSGGCSPLLLSLCWAQWLHLPGSDMYFYNHLWWLFSTTTIPLLLSVCRPRCLDFYDHFLSLFSTTSTFCVLGVMIPLSLEWCVLLWPPLVIILHYYYFPCVKHDVSSTTSTFCVLGIRIPLSSEWCVLLWCYPSKTVLSIHYWWFKFADNWRHQGLLLPIFWPSLLSVVPSSGINSTSRGIHFHHILISRSQRPLIILCAHSMSFLCSWLFFPICFA